MNLAQILRAALFDANVVHLDGTTHPFVTLPELTAWAQEGHALLYGKLRQANQDYGLVTRLSTDADLRWNGIVYDPSSFGLTTTARTYTLPPDLIELRQIRSVTSGEEDRIFRFLDFSDPQMVEQALVESTTTNESTIYYDIVGDRTLRLAQPPDVALDIELSYIARPHRLFLYSTGTISITQGTSAATGTSSEWVIEELATPCELIVSSGAVAPKVVSQTSTDPFVDPSALYPPISAFGSDTALTFLGTWLKASVTTKAYTLASVPSLPPDWQWLLVRWVTAMLKWKDSGANPADRPGVDTMVGSEMMPAVAQRQTADFVYVEDFDPE